MLFAIVLGLILGGASVLLVQQWLTGALVVGRDTGPVLTPTRFPHLAPPERRRRAA